jgi:hypothetical protein
MLPAARWLPLRQPSVSEGGFMYWVFVAITCVIAFGWVKVRRQRKGTSGSQASSHHARVTRRNAS